MTERTFYELFPNLKEKSDVACNWCFHKEDIQENCLDKQRVKHFMMTLKVTCYNANKHELWNKAWEELKLE